LNSSLREQTDKKGQDHMSLEFDRRAIFRICGVDICQTGEPAMLFVPVEECVDDQPERSKREDHESGCGALNIRETE
jgi:hypothetical protein